ncbi:hypothetical protein J6590_011595 [Homalodisca vitripennis]|nr:hypothetical protein J6590_011595 [Homalodisca vitripennis]
MDEGRSGSLSCGTSGSRCIITGPLLWPLPPPVNNVPLHFHCQQYDPLHSSFFSSVNNEPSLQIETVRVIITSRPDGPSCRAR